MDLMCWNCGESVADVPLPISRHANCRHCFEVLHCCRMCELFDPDKPDQCDHDRTDPPGNKETANFCEYFKPTNRFVDTGRQQGAAKSDLDSLFGDDDAEKTEEGGTSEIGASGDNPLSPKSKFDDLFND